MYLSQHTKGGDDGPQFFRRISLPEQRGGGEKSASGEKGGRGLGAFGGTIDSTLRAIRDFFNLQETSG